MMFVFCRATKGTEMWQVEEVGPLCLLRNTLGELQRQSGNKYGKQPQTLHLKWPNYMAIYLVRRTEIWKKYGGKWSIPISLHTHKFVNSLSLSSYPQNIMDPMTAETIFMWIELDNEFSTDDSNNK